MEIKKSIAMLLTAMVIAGVGINGQEAEASDSQRAQATTARILAQRQKRYEEFKAWVNSQSQEYKDKLWKIRTGEVDGPDKAWNIAWNDFNAWKSGKTRPAVMSQNNAISQHSGSSINLSQFPRAAEYSNKKVASYSNLFINASSHKIISLIYETETEYASDYHSGRKDEEARGVPLKYQYSNQVLTPKDGLDGSDYFTDNMGMPSYSKYPLYPGKYIYQSIGRAWPANENRRVIALLDNNQVLQTRFLMCEDVAYVITDTGIVRLAIPQGDGEADYKMRGVLSQLHYTGPANSYYQSWHDNK
ncbi:hypothetical protein [Selenomonas ruminantium]|uniref:Uncharacterized protein n=1 Tax=Selenomonas ruminantium TaxID=971 RepID=A0A1H0RNW9_SELRU|nr:hypothetical protein [Selenomonas ruminantium]SDP31099.1 hypothetical protein SAMN05216366_11330 [Selenomonas ruminantium]